LRRWCLLGGRVPCDSLSPPRAATRLAVGERRSVTLEHRWTSRHRVSICFVRVGGVGFGGVRLESRFCMAGLMAGFELHRSARSLEPLRLRNAPLFVRFSQAIRPEIDIESDGLIPGPHSMLSSAPRRISLHPVHFLVGRAVPAMPARVVGSARSSAQRARSWTYYQRAQHLSLGERSSPPHRQARRRRGARWPRMRAT